MTDVVGGIAITIDADIGPLVSQMDRAKSAIGGLRGVTDRTAAALRSFGDRATAAGKSMSMVTAGVTAAITGMALLAKNSAGTADAIGDASAAAGVSTKFFQDMGFAMGVAADMTQEEFGAALVRLNRTLGEAQQGSAGAVAAFEAIGISQADIASGAVSTEEAFDAYIAKMGEIRDPALAAALSTDLFGKAGAAMGGQLAGASSAVAGLVARADELGIAIGQKSIDAAGRFDTKWRELVGVVDALKVKIGTELLPVIVDRLIPALIDTVIPAISQVVGKIGEWIEWFGQLDPAVQTAAGAIATAFAVGGPVLVAIGVFTSALSTALAATGPIGLFIAAASLASAAWVTWGDEIKAAVGGAIDFITAKFQAFQALLQGIIDKAREVGRTIAETLSISPAAPDYQDNSDLSIFESGGSGLTGGGGNADLGGGNGTDTGAMMVNGMVNGIAMQMEARRPDIEAAAAVAEQIFRDKMEIQSPSQVFFRMGEFIGQGLSDGIASTSAMVGAAVDGMAGSAVDSTNAMASDILKGMDTLFGQSKSVGAAIALVNTLIGASQEIKKGVFGFASMAAVLARGYALVSAIKGAGKGGTGGGGVATASAPAERPLAVNLNTFGDGDFIRRSDLGDTLDRLNEIAGDRGYTILSERL